MGGCKFSEKDGSMIYRCRLAGVVCKGSAKDKEDCPGWRISFAIARTM